jgi:hypothetical protein
MPLAADLPWAASEYEPAKRRHANTAKVFFIGCLLSKMRYLKRCSGYNMKSIAEGQGFGAFNGAFPLKAAFF